MTHHTLTRLAISMVATIAVEERCAAITAAADEAVAKLLQELKSRLIGLPKKVRASKCCQAKQSRSRALA